MKQFYIYKIQLDVKKEHIQFVSANSTTANDTRYKVPRAFVAQLIHAGVSFKVKYIKDKAWHIGAEVDVYDEVFLRSNPNSKAADNLSNLEHF